MIDQSDLAAERRSTAGVLPNREGAGAGPILSFDGVSKSFSRVRALYDLDLDLFPGEMHALLGPNGAGKSTLVKMLDGIYTMDSGSVRLRGETIRIPDPRVAVIHQDLAVIDTFTIAENMALGAGGSGVVRRRAERAAAVRHLAEIGWDVDPDTRVADLSLAEKSMIMIGKALARGSEVLVIDEATAALPRTEAERFLVLVREALARTDSAALLVTHRMAELKWCDRATVLVGGRAVLNGGALDDPGQVDRITAAILDAGGFARPEPVPGAAGRTAGPVRISARRASAPGVGPVSLSVRAGEAVGLVGALDANVFGVGRLLAGVLAPDGGTIEFADDVDDRAIAFLGEDRQRDGTMPGLSVAWNMGLGNHRTLSAGGVMRRRHERRRVEELIRDLHVQPPRRDQLIEKLSGGNQQKVLIARAIMSDPDVLVVLEPSRGVDIGARERIHHALLEQKRRGCAVVVCTTELEDVAAVCDRVGFVRSGICTELVDVDRLDLEATLKELA